MLRLPAKSSRVIGDGLVLLTREVGALCMQEPVIPWNM